MSKEQHFWGPQGSQNVETSLSRYLRSVQKGNKYHIKRSITSPGQETKGSKKVAIPTPFSSPKSLKPPESFNQSLDSSKVEPLTPQLNPPLPPKDKLLNSQPLEIKLTEIQCQLQDVSQELKLHIQQLADKIDHLNENFIELIQCNRELVLEIRHSIIFPSQSKSRRSCARLSRSSPMNNSQILKSLIATTCFMTPFMVFFIDYYRVQ